LLVVTHTTLELVGATVVVAKRRAPAGPAGAGGPAGEDLLADARRRTEAEARWLAAARHPAVVGLRRVSTDRCRIETRHAGLATLRTAGPEPWLAAEILAAVALVLAQLHRRHLVHGNLSPDHVLLPGPGRPPMLCSPSGTASETVDDIDGLRAVTEAVMAGWDRPSRWWGDAVGQLRHDRDRISARQAATVLAGLKRRRPSSWWPGPGRSKVRGSEPRG
jgi:hypothetical protein